jgi:hypothetical protein
MRCGHKKRAVRFLVPTTNHPIRLRLLGWFAAQHAQGHGPETPEKGHHKSMPRPRKIVPLRTRIFKVRLTEEEWFALSEHAAKAALTPSELCADGLVVQDN